MGGCCCCASKSNEDIGTSPFFHYAIPEEHRPSPNHVTASVLSSGFLVDTNLDTSIPDSYQPPPAPIPYETYSGHPPRSSGNQESSECKREVAPQPTNTESIEDINAGRTMETKVKNLGSDEEGGMDIELEASKEIEDENLDDLKKSGEPFVPQLQDEDDTCPICLEEYDVENPKLITKCDHHFHLACILEWMERSDTCPVCDQEMVLVPVE